MIFTVSRTTNINYDMYVLRIYGYVSNIEIKKCHDYVNLINIFMLIINNFLIIYIINL